jgi:hypothetical protein
MEETKKTEEIKEVQMISVEQANAQMQHVLTQANTKIQQLATHTQHLEEMLRDRTLEYLFKVFKYSHMFNNDFIIKCTDAVEKYLTQVALTEPTQEETVPGTTSVNE